MLRGHDTLTRLIGKRRKLSLSALSPNKRVLSVAKKEVKEDVSSVATFVNVKDEGAEIRCPASVDEQTSTEADELAGESTSLSEVERVVVKSETEVCTSWSQILSCARSTDGCEALTNHRGFGQHRGPAGLKRKSKQVTLSRFFTSGVNKILDASPTMQVQTLTEEKTQTSFVTIKIEDVAAERPPISPASAHSRLKLNRVKTQIKQEIDLKYICNDSCGSFPINSVLHGGSCTSLVGSNFATAAAINPATSNQPLPVVPVEAKIGDCPIAFLNSIKCQGNTACRTKVEPMCRYLCHHLPHNGEDLHISQRSADEIYTHEIHRGKDVVAINGKATERASFPRIEAENLSHRTSSLTQTAGNLFVGEVVTRIVGRRYNRRVPCEEGMKVTILREPENPVDSNAIKIVPFESPLGPALGHLPKEISAHLSLLLDRGLVQVKGFVVSVPEKIHGDVTLKLSFESTNSCTELSVRDEAAESWQRMILAAESRSSLHSTAVRAPKYQQNFVAVLQTVLERDSHLFTVQEKDYLGKFFSLSGDAQRLFIRLYQRKGPWFRISGLSYKDVAGINTALEELSASGYMTSSGNVDEASEVSLRARIEILTMPELKQLASSLQKKSEAATSRREELITLLVSTALEKHFNVEGLTSRRRTVLEMAAEITGPCIRVSEQAEFFLWRVQRLFFLDREGDLSTFLAVDMGRVKYPRYKCLKSRHVFPTYEALVAYEQALEIAQGMDMSLEINDVELALSFLQRARDELSCCEVVQSAADAVPQFLARFSASYVYKNVITVGVSLLERERRYKEAVDALKQLLRSKVRSGRWGYWTLRLSVNLDHLGCKEESLRVAEAGVNEPWIRGGDRVALQRRVVRLGKPPRRWKKPPYADALNRKCKEVQILGRPLNSVTGKKSRFYGYDGKLCGVEELALQYYASGEGGSWDGVHCEGGVLLTLFGLLMWDVLFADIPDVFQNAFQTAPLDLDTELFYLSRQRMVETRLDEIAGGNVESIITQTWNENFGTMCNGVNWERHSLAQLLVITKCIGGLGLSHVCRLLAEDHAGWRGGMPDLLLWRITKVDIPSDSSVCPECRCSSQGNCLPVDGAVESVSSEESCAVEEGTQRWVLSNGKTVVKGEAKLVEVKGPRDRLSEQQLAWIWILMNGGLSVEVCKVLEVMKFEV